MFDECVNKLKNLIILLALKLFVCLKISIKAMIHLEGDLMVI